MKKYHKHGTFGSHPIKQEHKSLFDRTQHNHLLRKAGMEPVEKKAGCKKVTEKPVEKLTKSNILLPLVNGVIMVDLTKLGPKSLYLKFNDTRGRKVELKVDSF